MFWAFVLLIGINVLYVFVGVLNFPLRSVDAYSDWMFKAKVLYLSPSFPLHFFQNWEYMAAHMQYPILLPLLFSTLYSVFGFNDHFITFLYPLMYLMIVLLCWKTLRAIHIHPHIAIACTYLYSMLSPLLAQGGRTHAGNADIVLVLLYWVAIYILIKYQLTNKILLFLIVIAMSASQIKSEGMLLISLFVFLPLSRNQKMIAIMMSLFPTVLWSYYIKQHNFASDLFYAPITIHEFLLRTGSVIYGYLLELINYRNWYIFWVVSILLLFVPVELHSKTKKILLPTALSMLVVIMGSYVFAHFTRSEIHILRYVISSADRVLFQLSPFVLLYFAESLSSVLRPYFTWPKVSRH